MAETKKPDEVTLDMEAFLRAAKYTLVKFTDMNNEMKEEAMDTCITAVEKYPNDQEKCTQVWPMHADDSNICSCVAACPRLARELLGLIRIVSADDQGPDGQEVRGTVARSRRARFLL